MAAMAERSGVPVETTPAAKNPFWDRATWVTLVSRGVLVVLAAVAGGMLSGGVGQKDLELNRFLAAAGYSLLSVARAKWGLAAPAVVAALLWLVVNSWRHPGRSDGQSFIWGLLFWVNRQLAHIEAAVFMAVALVISDLPLAVKLPLVTFVVFLLGPVLLTGIGLRVWHAGRGAQASEGKRDGLILYAHAVRRSLLCALTVTSVLWLLLGNWSQMKALAVLAITLVVANVLRVVATLFNTTRRTAAGGKEAESIQDSFWMNPQVDKATLGLVLLVMALGLALPMRGRFAIDARSGWLRNRWGAADKVDGGPADERRIGLFLVADSQFHQVSGTLSGLQIGVVDALDPVAVRPVELDILSAGSLAQFSRVYRETRRLGEKEGRWQQLQWAHLGDFGDVGCQAEVLRIKPYLEDFGLADLAGLAAGNHDSTFLGNFSWHPDWPNACKPQNGTPGAHDVPADKPWVNGQLATVLDGRGQDPEKGGVLARDHAHPAHLAHVQRLGNLDADEVWGVFLDTSDYTPSSPGFAGAFGEVTDTQMSAVSRALGEKLDALKAKKGHLRVIVFMHHPFDELTDGSQKLLRGLAHRLGKDVLLAVVSAHTHLAALRNFQRDTCTTAGTCRSSGGTQPSERECQAHATCTTPVFHCKPTDGGVGVPEFVIGSTIDPPQEAALLEVARLGQGFSVTLTTLPAVRRPSVSCAPAVKPPPASDGGPGPTELIDAGLCQDLIGALRPPPRRDRVAAGNSRSLCWPLLDRNSAHDSDFDAATLPDLKAKRARRASRLMTCLCRPLEEGGAPYCSLPRTTAASPEMDDAEIGAALRTILQPPGPRDAPDPARQRRYQEAVCMGWIASIQQGHKNVQLSFAQSARVAFEELAAPPALQMFYGTDRNARPADMLPPPHGELWCHQKACIRPRVPARP
jgi:hypothetical protein